MSNYPEHIQKLITEAKTVPYKSEKYWALRCEYIEKYIDTTYSQVERSNCLMLWDILRFRSA